MEFNNNNDKQVYFNQVKGVVTEINEGEVFCSLTLMLDTRKKDTLILFLKEMR